MKCPCEDCLLLPICKNKGQIETVFLRDLKCIKLDIFLLSFESYNLHKAKQKFEIVMEKKLE